MISISFLPGDAPYCESNETFCDFFALNYVCNDTKGDDGQECVNGTKVLCSYPDPEPLPLPTPITTLKVLAYNVWELRYLFAQNGQRERTCRSTREVLALQPDLDVIVFNEVFMGGCFAENDTLTLRDILHEHGFVYYTKNVGEPVSFPKVENGGVFIASRWPIKKEAQIVYKNAERGTADYFSGKGCMYAQVEKTVDLGSKTYHIFGTHLQAQNGSSNDEVRVLQAGEIHTFMLEQNIPADEPVIYAGDLNADKIGNADHAAEVLMTLQANLPQIVGEFKATYDTELNDVFFESDDSYQWLDYALFSDNHAHPTKATLQVLRPLSPEHVPVCMAAISPDHTYPDSDLCFISKRIRDLSDHFPVLGVFDYADEPESTTIPPVETTSGDRRSFITPMLIFCSFFISLSFG